MYQDGTGGPNAHGQASFLRRHQVCDDSPSKGNGCTTRETHEQSKDDEQAQAVAHRTDNGGDDKGEVCNVQNHCSAVNLAHGSIQQRPEDVAHDVDGDGKGGQGGVRGVQVVHKQWHCRGEGG